MVDWPCGRNGVGDCRDGKRSKGNGSAMNIHEYQAKQLLAKFGVAVPRGGGRLHPG